MDYQYVILLFLILFFTKVSEVVVWLPQLEPKPSKKDEKQKKNIY